MLSQEQAFLQQGRGGGAVTAGSGRQLKKKNPDPVYFLGAVVVSNILFVVNSAVVSNH